MHKTLAAGAALLASFCLAGHATAAARRSMAPPRQWTKANADLEAAIQRAETNGHELPRLADPKTRGLLLAAFDERVFSQMDPGNPIAFMDPVTVVTTCDQSVGFVTAYASHGLSPAMLATLHSSGLNAIKAQMARNAVIYQDEQTLALDFATTCFGHQITAAKTMFDAMPPDARDPGVIQGVHFMVTEAPEIYIGVLGSQGNASLSLANRTRGLDRAVQYADAYATMLKPSERKVAIGVIDAILPSAPPANRTKLLRIREIMSKPCMGQLCALDPKPAGNATGRAR